MEFGVFQIFLLIIILASSYYAVTKISALAYKQPLEPRKSFTLNNPAKEASFIENSIDINCHKASDERLIKLNSFVEVEVSFSPNQEYLETEIHN